jgi:hypothetical protein
VPEAGSPGCCGQRDLFVTGPGPDAGGSNQGKPGCIQTLVKSGIEVAPSVSPLAGPPPGVTVCPRADVTTTAANAINARKFRCLRMPTSVSMVFHERSQGRSHGSGLKDACPQWSLPLASEGLRHGPLTGPQRNLQLFHRNQQMNTGAPESPVQAPRRAPANERAPLERHVAWSPAQWLRLGDHPITGRSNWRVLSLRRRLLAADPDSPMSRGRLGES